MITVLCLDALSHWLVSSPRPRRVGIKTSTPHTHPTDTHDHAAYLDTITVGVTWTLVVFTSLLAVLARVVTVGTLVLVFSLGVLALAPGPGGLG